MSNKFIEHILKTIDIHRAAVSYGEDFTVICPDTSRDKLQCEYTLVTIIADILDSLKDKDIQTIREFNVDLWAIYESSKTA